MFSAWHKLGTNMQIMSAPQQGKSKTAVLFGQVHTLERNPFAVGDYHGPLYDELVSFLTFMRPRRPVILVNLSEPGLINPINLFEFKGGNLTAHVSRLTHLILQAWGIEDSDELPRFESVMGIVISYMAVTKTPLHYAAKLLDYGQKALRAHAISVLPEEYREDVRQLQLLPFPRFMDRVESTRNKLRRFVADESVRNFVGLPNGFSVGEIWDKGGILLVRAAPSDYLSDQSARACLALITGAFFDEARKRMTTPRPFYLYADEAQAWLPPDSARMLNEVPKSGLRLTLINHHSSEFHKRPYVMDAIRSACGIKMVMGGTLPEQAHELAEEFFYHELNDDWPKQPIVHYATEHALEDYEVVTESDSWTEGESYSKGESSSSSEGMLGELETASFSEGGSYSSGWSKGSTSGLSVAWSTRYCPNLVRIEDGWEFYNLEEKRSILAARFRDLRKRESYVKLTNRAYFWKVPRVRTPLLSADTILKYIQGSQIRAYLPEHAQHISEEQAIPERSVHAPPRNKKEPPRLHPQG